MSDWFIIVPEQGVNLITEPSFEVGIATWTAAGSARTRQTTESKFGVASLRLVTANAGANEGAYFSHNPGAAGTFTGSIWVYGTGGTARIRVRDQSNGTETAGAPVTLGAWQRIEVTHTAGAACADLRLYVETNIQQNITYYADAAQLEEQTYSTTYVDGDQEGCEWLGAAHASASQRSAQSRAGGRVQDLQDDYHLDIGQFISTGMPPLDLAVDSYAILPGGELNSIKVQSRVFTLTGVIRGTSTANLHANRQALLNVLKPGAVPGDQPVRIRYTGAAVEKQIAAHYEGGLETSIAAEMECWERVAIRFLADDPFWYEIGESAEELDSEDGDTFYYVAGRLRSTGQWDNLGLTAIPDIGGTVYAAVIGPDKNLYIGGAFVDLNNTGTGIDYVARYDPVPGTWHRLGGASDFNALVYALVFGPDGTLYAGGNFTDVAADLDADYVAKWDGAAWSAVEPDGTGSVRALAVGLDGTLYIGGQFLDWDADPLADNIVCWDGVTYEPLGSGFNSVVEALVIAPDGTLYAGGGFTFSGAIPILRLGAWDGSDWTAVYSGAGFNAGIDALAVRDDGVLFAGGVFTNIDGVVMRYIAEWDGQAWTALGSNTNARVYALALGDDGMLYVGGDFTAAGGITLADRVAKWNGSSWAHLDVNLPGVPTVFAIATGPVAPNIPTNYDLWLGFTTTGAAVFAGDMPVVNDGTESAYPKIVVSRTGGTSAILEEVRNETTGKELLFDYALLDGETLTIDLTPTQKSIISSFFGPRPDAILPNSDFGSFVLQSGDNLVTCFVATDATVESFLIWENTYWSND